MQKRVAKYSVRQDGVSVPRERIELSEGHLEQLRKTEFTMVKSWLTRGSHVLEIGGGNGYQALLISALGCEISSIDISNRKTLSKSYYPVQDYDGKNIPFSDASFDIVFSSNVLEHIQDVPSTLAEISRVLKPGGICIHILPTPAWRFWTILAHYLYILKYSVGLRRPYPGETIPPSVKGLINKKGFRHMIKRALIPGPHGDYPSACSELYYYRKSRWQRIFREGGFNTLTIFKNGVFYTGYGLWPSLSISVRKKIAKFLGSSCNIFILSITTKDTQNLKVHN